MFLSIIFLVGGFLILILGADKLVDGSSSIAKKLKVSSLIIGLTVVALGTSMPEFVVNLISSIKGSSDMVMGNVLGSNIFNVLCIGGLTALVFPIVVKKSTVYFEIPITIIASLAILFMSIMGDYLISRFEGIILLSCFIAFILYTIVLSKKGNNLEGEFEIREFTLLSSIIRIIIGIIGLTLGGKLLVDGAINIAHYMGVSERIIGLTIVSVGTSLPELATSMVAARKKNVGIAIGNILGSNIFNIFMVLASSAIVRPISISNDSNIDILVSAASVILLLLLVVLGKKFVISRVSGFILFTSYVAYIIIILFSK